VAARFGVWLEKSLEGSTAKLLSEDEARRIAAMELKLSQALLVFQYLDEQPSEFNDEDRAHIKRIIADVPFANCDARGAHGSEAKGERSRAMRREGLR
jgi:hypothetical protein